MTPPSVLIFASNRSVLTVNSSLEVAAGVADVAPGTPAVVGTLPVAGPLLAAAGTALGTSLFFSAGAVIDATGLGGAGGAFSFCHA